MLTMVGSIIGSLASFMGDVVEVITTDTTGIMLIPVGIMVFSFAIGAAQRLLGI